MPRHPFYSLAVGFLLQSEVHHGVGGGGAVPVFFAGGDPDDIAGVDFVLGLAPALHPAQAGGDEEGLAQGMRMPGGA
jgi:hypothetical protein